MTVKVLGICKDASPNEGFGASFSVFCPCAGCLRSSYVLCWAQGLPPPDMPAGRDEPLGGKMAEVSASSPESTVLTREPCLGREERHAFLSWDRQDLGWARSPAPELGSIARAP